MNGICDKCGKPVLNDTELKEAKEMEQKQGVDRRWVHTKCIGK